MAAAMYSTVFPSMATLLAWAADPWSFWYPPEVEQLIDFSLSSPPPPPPPFTTSYRYVQNIIQNQ
jgi:hypothetical protein